ncbi:hypothetical protein O6H91_17G043900 [Diphasiastrum complanatum]|uniref:Uncharacterized protein n=1 Tax=Diphasiastrum complanatum TaxID=34168 RepID=A0ACC2B680_DIPCM|nr:hypothetical protein O6H91_17G043900 [Diphasiastrum complanatum]
MTSQDVVFLEGSKNHRSFGLPPRIRTKSLVPLKEEMNAGELSGALMVIGKHALLFDDDGEAEFTNSPESLLPWNGDEKVLIDRYDVRHLLQDLSGLRRRHMRPVSPDATQEELNYERYRDMKCSDDHEIEDEESVKRQKTSVGAYRSVGFSYDATSVSQNSATNLDLTLYHPPFPLPKDLEANLPPSEKVHQIIAGTAKFVSEHGGQSEIILRVKQANNPSFGFLMPDNHLHAYFRYLVEHAALVGAFPKAPQQSVVSIDKSSEGLSMLGDIYGDEEEEEDEVRHVTQSADDSKVSSIHGEQGGSSPGDSINEDGWRQGKYDSSSSKQRAEHSEYHGHSNDTGLSGNASPISCHSGSLQSELRDEVTCKTCDADEIPNAVSASLEPPPPGTRLLEQISSNNSQDDVSIAMGPSGMSVVHQDPPLQTGRIIDKMVKFISRNGKEFEAIVRERDNADGRFQFLLPSNEHHAYYAKALKVAQEAENHKESLREEDLRSKVARSSGKAVQVEENVSKQKPKAPRSTSITSSLIEVPVVTKAMLRHMDPEVCDLSEAKTCDAGDASAGLGISSDAAAAVVRAATRGHLQFSLTKKVPKDVDGKSRQPIKEHDKKPCGMSLDAAAEAVMAATHGPWKKRKDAFARKVERSKLAVVGTSMGKLNSAKDLAEAPKCPDSKEESLFNGCKDKVSGLESRESKPDLIHHESHLHQEDAKVAAKAAAAAAAHEADSADARLTPEEKRKAERLKRAKLFAAMIQSGANVLGKVERGSDTYALSSSLNVDVSDQPAASYSAQVTHPDGNTRKSGEEVCGAGSEQECVSGTQEAQASKVDVLVEVLTVESLKEKPEKRTDKQHRHRRRHRHHRRRHHHEDSIHCQKESYGEDEGREISHSDQEVDEQSFCATRHAKNEDRKKHGCSHKKGREGKRSAQVGAKGHGGRPRENHEDALPLQNEETESARSSDERAWRTEDAALYKAKIFQSRSSTVKKGNDDSPSVASQGSHEQRSKQEKNVRKEKGKYSYTEDGRDSVEEPHNEKKGSGKRDRTNSTKNRHSAHSLVDIEDGDSPVRKKRATHRKRTSCKHEDAEECSCRDSRSILKGVEVFHELRVDDTERLYNKQGGSGKEEASAAAIAATDVPDDLRAKVRAMLLQIH